jgi:hypothetical protein
MTVMTAQLRNASSIAQSKSCVRVTVTVMNRSGW